MKPHFDNGGLFDRIWREPMRLPLVSRSVLPDSAPDPRLSLDVLVLLLLIPVAALVVKGSSQSASQTGPRLSPRAPASFRVSLLASPAARRNPRSGSAGLGPRPPSFPGRRSAGHADRRSVRPPHGRRRDHADDALRPNGMLGRILAPLGVPVAYTPAGIGSRCFRDGAVCGQDAAAGPREPRSRGRGCGRSLGSSRGADVPPRDLPEFLPAVVTGVRVVFARALGEYGSVIFISGNMPMRTETFRS